MAVGNLHIELHSLLMLACVINPFAPASTGHGMGAALALSWLLVHSLMPLSDADNAANWQPPRKGKSYKIFSYYKLTHTQTQIQTHCSTFVELFMNAEYILFTSIHAYK